MARTKKARIPKSYLWRDGYHHKGVKAEAVARELDKIAKKCGGTIKSVEIVKAASSPKSLLHPLLEWEDGKAAALYRKNQAGRLLNSLIVVYEGTEGEVLEVPYLVSYSPSETRNEGNVAEHSYVQSEVIRNDPQLRQAVIERAWDELLSWKLRYEHLSEFMGVRAAIDKVRKAA
jgi:hypothetical protein